jgi:hypothetical protein
VQDSSGDEVIKIIIQNGICDIETIKRSMLILLKLVLNGRLAEKTVQIY